MFIFSLFSREEKQNEGPPREAISRRAREEQSRGQETKTIECKLKRPCRRDAAAPLKGLRRERIGNRGETNKKWWRCCPPKTRQGKSVQFKFHRGKKCSIKDGGKQGRRDGHWALGRERRQMMKTLPALPFSSTWFFSVGAKVFK